MTDSEYIRQMELTLRTMLKEGTTFQDHLDNMRWGIFCCELLDSPMNDIDGGFSSFRREN